MINLVINRLLWVYDAVVVPLPLPVVHSSNFRSIAASPTVSSASSTSILYYYSISFIKVKKN